MVVVIVVVVIVAVVIVVLVVIVVTLVYVVFHYCCIFLFTGLGLARFYTNSPGAEKFRPGSLSVANNLLSPVLRPRAMFLKRFVYTRSDECLL